MIVRCVANTSADLPEGYLDPASGYTRGTSFDLTAERDYVVYGIAVRAGQIWYYLCGDAHPDYPVIYPAPLFAVTRNELSRYWVYGYTPERRDHTALLSFAPWVTDARFYDRLTDLEEEELSTFRRYRRLMDSEQTMV
jgi:hypothetical protein